MKYILLIVGFALLIKGADLFVDGSSSVAKRLKVSTILIGMTIVAMGTSLPECSVSVSAAIAGKNGLAISNAVGSNIFNLMVVCGICALFYPLTVSISTLKKEFPFSVLVAILLLLCGITEMIVNNIEGILLLLFFVAFIIWMIMSAKKARKNGVILNQEEYKLLPAWKCILFIIGGITAIIIGGNLVVNSATEIAKDFGMSDNLIGLTVVAFGTSLPELVTSVVAAKKKEIDMALGNVIGSNIFNILFVLGIAATIAPITFSTENIIDIILLITMSIMVWLFAWKKKKIIRIDGLIMLLCYAAYFVYICMR